MLSIKSSKTGQQHSNEWDKAISDAEDELRSVEKRIGRLRTAIRIFKENRRSDVPWPGSADGVIGQAGD